MVKRSRIGTSSNLADANVINYVTSPRADVVGHVSDKTGGFLQQCFYCKSRIFDDKEVFLFREHAFCTLLCREFQIMREKGKEKQTAKRKMVD